MASSQAEEFEPARTQAVVIGVLEWKHGLSAFPKTNRKDRELRDVLVARGVPPENIRLLLDDAATLKNIRSAIAQAVAHAGPGATLILYYAGHGWPTGENDYCLANYDIQLGKPESEWSMNGLGATLAEDFRGKQVFLWADCCYSGGLQVVVDALAQRGVAAFSLTSAGMANTSTRNWTFTQSILDALRGEPLVDANGDGQITLLEMNSEVGEAMKHLEGQAHGFKVNGIDAGLVVARSTGRRPSGTIPAIPIGSYVEASGGGRRHFGRVVATEQDHVIVQFYDYTQKRTVTFAASDITLSKRTARTTARLEADIKPDCLIEWRGTWFPAKVLLRTSVDQQPRYFIHYLGYHSSWDEWVGSERIRFLEQK
jgi:hypothetical protein